jgi:hypothetical protein
MIYRGPWAFSRSYDLYPTSLTTHRKTEKEIHLADGRAEGVGEEPNHTGPPFSYTTSLQIPLIPTNLFLTHSDP